mmetsp:Transcript_62482/g.101206  ORF Transcript_62482/g.101206 Transcript_62482/m.101206 type:complete len:235 (-) Transcript_62482:597-1301(-)
MHERLVESTMAQVERAVPGSGRDARERSMMTSAASPGFKAPSSMRGKPKFSPETCATAVVSGHGAFPSLSTTILMQTGTSSSPEVSSPTGTVTRPRRKACLAPAAAISVANSAVTSPRASGSSPAPGPSARGAPLMMIAEGFMLVGYHWVTSVVTLLSDSEGPPPFVSPVVDSSFELSLLSLTLFMSSVFSCWPQVSSPSRSPADPTVASVLAGSSSKTSSPSSSLSSSVLSSL